MDKPPLHVQRASSNVCLVCLLYLPASCVFFVYLRRIVGDFLEYFLRPAPTPVQAAKQREREAEMQVHVGAGGKG